MDCMITGRNGCLSAETARDHEKDRAGGWELGGFGHAAWRRGPGTRAGVEGAGGRGLGGGGGGGGGGSWGGCEGGGGGGGCGGEEGAEGGVGGGCGATAVGWRRGSRLMCGSGGTIT